MKNLEQIISDFIQQKEDAIKDKSHVSLNELKKAYEYNNSGSADYFEKELIRNDARIFELKCLKTELITYLIREGIIQ